MTGIARTIRAFLDTLTRRRGERVLHVVDQAPLFGGCTLHVVDVASRRLVFASTTSGAVCLLAHFEAPSETVPTEGAGRQNV